jgi:S1-C subfamily serine protease
MIPWSQGIGFAIAVDTLKGVYDELVETGTVQTPWMGIVGVTLNKGIASHYNLHVEKGVLLVEVPRGPSRSMGLKSGDVIIAIDDGEISGMEELRRKIMRGKVGQKLMVRFQRGSEVFEGYVELMAAPQ